MSDDGDVQMDHEDYGYDDNAEEEYVASSIMEAGIRDRWERKAHILGISRNRTMSKVEKAREKGTRNWVMRRSSS
jgi:hypothetical protein